MALFEYKNILVYLCVPLHILTMIHANPLDLQVRLQQIRLDPDYNDALNEIENELDKKFELLPYKLYRYNLKVAEQQPTTTPNTHDSNDYDDHENENSSDSELSAAIAGTSTPSTATAEHSDDLEAMQLEEDIITRAQERMHRIVVAMTGFMRNFFSHSVFA